MNKDEAWRILDKYQAKNGWDAIQTATVISHLEAEIAALQTRLARCAVTNAMLRAENKKLRLALADGTLFESDSHIDSMIATTVEWVDGHAVRTKFNTTD